VAVHCGSESLTHTHTLSLFVYLHLMTYVVVGAALAVAARRIIGIIIQRANLRRQLGNATVLRLPICRPAPPPHGMSHGSDAHTRVCLF
jgi:hypothetical protein